jgi:hypothetical protein
MSRRLVNVGQRIEAGQQIALRGNEGQSTGPHLHLRVYAHAGDGHGIDPIGYLKARGITLPCTGGEGGLPPGPTECHLGKGKVIGAINEKYVSIGGCNSFLGLPQSDEQTANDQKGRYTPFEHGMIYWTPATGAHEVHGDIATLWTTLKKEAGSLGYPVTDEVGAPDKRGRYSVFEKGSIYWTPTTNAHAVIGVFRDKWKELGWESGSLGYPTADEHDSPEGRRVDFEHGWMTLDPATKEVKAVVKDDNGDK